ncbi:unnamed protein product [marine sediment metagenome]|uniref:HEPN domain-containing protein n=1 Tax=marine sediment metagenome TaxID=412755 RepID=X1BWC8_9ZZZZ
MFNPNDFLVFSKNLLKKGGKRLNEALFRSITSRTYYSAFLTAREQIDSINPTLLIHSEGYRMHKQVVDTLNNPDFRFFQQERHLGGDLYELQKWRIDADYHFPSACDSLEYCQRINPDTKMQALSSITYAEIIINQINNLG